MADTKKKSSTKTKKSTSSKKTSSSIAPIQAPKKMGFGSLLGLSSQERMIGVLTVALVGASFFLGYFYGQLTVLKGEGSALARNNPSPAGGAAAPTAPAPENEPLADAAWRKLLVSPAAAKGPENAKVTIVEFTDYECPFCGRHFEQTNPQIQANYVDTGKVRYIARDLPLPFHNNAHTASQAARCAGDQNAYWEMHQALFEGQQEWTGGDAASIFSNYASQLGLNVSQFDTCLSSEKYKAAVDADLALAAEVGATGTPTFFINGERVVGAQPYSAFEAVIEDQL